MLNSIARNLRTFLWSLLLALAVWLAAVTAADPDQVRALPNPIRVEVVGQDPGLVVDGSLPKEVQLTLRAPQSVWDQITARPDAIRAILDLSGLGAGEHDLSMQIQVPERPVRIVSANPSTVTVSLEPLVTRTLPLQATVSGQPAIGYEAGQLAMDPKQVVLAGPQSIVNRVKSARIGINVSGTRENVDESIPIQVVDQNKAPVAGVTIQPSAAHVTLPITRQGGFRDLAVKVIVRGQVANGYRLDSISVSPPVVTVFSSNPDLVNALPGVVETQPLDLQAAKDNVTLRVPLNLPGGVSAVGDQTVVIQAGISPIQSSLTLSSQQVEITGLASDMESQISPATVDVILSGPLPVLNSLSRQDVHVIVDVAGLAPGSYQLTPMVQTLASGVTVESLLPATVEVVLAPKTSPTPKP
ncbi:MAG TPA: CdaR family protein [Anaerolineales bacterium]|nr:CdaR family protein [Anaerolineales bacterium]